MENELQSQQSGQVVGASYYEVLFLNPSDTLSLYQNTVFRPSFRVKWSQDNIWASQGADAQVSLNILDANGSLMHQKLYTLCAAGYNGSTAPTTEQQFDLELNSLGPIGEYSLDVTVTPTEACDSDTINLDAEAVEAFLPFQYYPVFPTAHITQTSVSTPAAHAVF
ncbi:MAG: hypothetical protein IPJ88_02680 [Myxococcales bacterium]|nr:MAG: hypothetical protein IPJ88_02680 [Myxococcales bacterium]